MRSTNLVLLVLFLALGILLVGGWRILQDESTSADSAVEAAGSPSAISNDKPPPESHPTPLTPTPPPAAIQRRNQPSNNVAASNPKSVPTTSTPLIVDWEERLELLLDSDLPDLELSQHILALWPHLPRTNQVDAAQYLADFTPDESYASLLPILINPATDGEVVDELMTDLLNRPDSLQLPLFLDIAKTPGHPRQETALEYLDLYLEEDYGQDWARWEQAVQRYLKENSE